ncbi:HrpE/YscL family type III secretion apparatus protein [Noviherbaspirillum sp. CPCC 100848]|uniref:Type 3 secretion system stator protein n=1 Tax=Noviherbaspirillum album TaxID=3080276 RepID=A0ABU6JBB7_9BURK|nr:HrpE/YscL family type III secretion apparatus protein [Noviherbaspirillum sp. CPCC 100848]MEC4720726.1 HrpE/YscL family type III secretion apparatus protein [Noviherbaspirillum sp. CPCC 100848]
MGFIQFKDINAAHLIHADPASAVSKADEVRVLLEQSRILNAARDEAARIVASAQSAYEAECRRGYEDGLAEAKMEQAERMIESVSRTVEFFSRIEGEMVNLVMESVQKIINGFDDTERIVIVVRNAISVVRNQKQITLRLNPGQVETVKKQMHALLADYQGVGQLDVISDPRLSPDSCILESEIGIVEASIEGQLLALKNAFEKVLGSRR